MDVHLRNAGSSGASLVPRRECRSGGWPYEARSLQPFHSMEAATHTDEKMSELVRMLRERFIEEPPEDYLPGKTTLRNALMSHYRCSALHAEELVDRMESLGYVRYERGAGPGDPGVWRVRDSIE